MMGTGLIEKGELFYRSTGLPFTCELWVLLEFKG